MIRARSLAVATFDPWVLALLSVFAASTAGADWMASGRFSYTDRLYDLSGFAGTATAPVREADVEVYDLNSLVVLASGATDSNGDFSLAVVDGSTRDVGVRVLSSTNETASLDFRVVDDASGNATYVYHEPSRDESSHPPNDDVDFGSMTMPAAIGNVATTDWSSQVFNIFDMALLLADWVALVDGSRPSVGVSVRWNPTNGRAVSFYSGSSNRVFLSDDDGYDDPNILHELGHYIEDEFGGSQNTGGAHFISDDDQDPRLSWSEGVASFFSNASLELAGRPRPDLYSDRNSFSVGGGGGFAYQLESSVSGGSTNEQAVNAALWDIIDSAASLDASPSADDDPLSDPHANIWAVVEQMRVASPANTQLEDFWTIWFDLELGNLVDLQSTFAGHQIDFATDAQEPNGTPASAALLTASYQENSFYRSGALPGGDEDWFRFPATSGSYYRIEVNGAPNSIYGRPDPELFLLGTHLEPLGSSDDPYDTSLNDQSSPTAQDMDETAPSILFRASATGDHYVYVRHASYPLNRDGRYGTYQIRVLNPIPPTPGVSDVASQRMLPGESYQALVVGSDFALGAAVTLSHPGLIASEVTWLSPTALVATIDVAGGVANGSYSLTVSNPEAGSGVLGSAVEVNSSSQPPVVLSEVELGADRVEVRNLGSTSAVLTNWQIRSYRPGALTNTFSFPTFTLPAGATVVISDSAGTDTATELFDPSGLYEWPWSSGAGGGVSLVDAGGRNVDSLRFVDSFVDEHEAPLGSGGLWMQPEVLSPAAGSTLSRSERGARYRSRLGLSAAHPTMPVGASGRENALDAWEDNDEPRRARLFSTDATLSDLAISLRPSGVDQDWFGFAIAAGRAVDFVASFTNADGNLDMELYPPGEESLPIVIASSTLDDESIALTSALSATYGGGVYRLLVRGFSGAVNSYRLTAVPGPVCGDGTLDPGETCDDGNTTSGDCCSASCQIEPSGAVCRAAADVCDVAEACDGVADSCPADGFEPIAKECRGAVDVCDAPDFCDGITAGCTADLKLTTECRAAAGICDVAEMCDGIAHGCPVDVFEKDTTECRPAMGACDLTEFCSGVDGACPGEQSTNGLACPDNSVCNGDEACNELATCAPGTVLDCADDDPCTADGCDAITGCFHEPIADCAMAVPALDDAVRPLFVSALALLGAVLLDRERRSRATARRGGEAP